MLEKIIENWLDKAGEKSFQNSFCAMLIADGYTIVHLTRHCAMEMGKDILALDKDGNPCAFQLKGNPGSRLSLHQWREEVSKQVIDLVSGKIVHPSLATSGKQHKAFLVTNGDLDEEVSRAIDDMNGNWKNQGLPYHLDVIVRGQMYKMAITLGLSLWPNELDDTKLLLELYLSAGTDVLDREKVNILLEKMLISSNGDLNKRSKESWKRHYSSSVLLTSIALKSYSEKKNHLAEIEAWVILANLILASSEMYSVEEKFYREEYELAIEACNKSVLSLLEEALSLNDLIEGEPITDKPYGIYNVRITWLLSLASYYLLFKKLKKIPHDSFDDRLIEFIERYFSRSVVLGEASLGQWLVKFWAMHTYKSKDDRTQLVHNLLGLVVESNQPKGERPLASPYYLVDQLVPYFTGVVEKSLKDSFHGSSYYVELLLNLSVRHGKKEHLLKIWPLITRLNFKSFIPTNIYDFYRSQVKIGMNLDKQPKHTKDWKELKQESDEHIGEDLPNTLKSRPELLLLISIFKPYRLTASAGRWMDTLVNKL